MSVGVHVHENHVSMLSASAKSLRLCGQANYLQTLVIDLKLQKYLEISESPDSVTFKTLLVAFAADLDFGVFTAAVAADSHGQGPGGDFVSNVGNLPAAYIAAAQHVQYAGRDPVLERLKRLSVPFCYDQALYVDNGAADLWDFQAPFGFRTGIAVALHLPEGKHFLLGFDRERPLPADGPKLVGMLGSLALVATYAQAAAFRLAPSQEESCSVAKLTRRELEVLRWTLDGKTAWEIGRILSISYDTVLSHTKGAMRKFGVSSKHQAALKAVASGLLKL